MPREVEEFCARVASRSLVVGIVGMGYVGIPLALSALSKGFRVIGFDIDRNRVDGLNSGLRSISHIDMTEIKQGLAEGRFEATADFSRLAELDAILIAVPTPLNRYREPDLSYVITTVEAIGKTLRRGQLVVLESTTYPGTTAEVIRPQLEALSGLRSGKDFFLAYSPEREDPGNDQFNTGNIPKVIGGDSAGALRMADAFYSAIVVRTVPVSSATTAEAVKLTENIFRAVNIALVNELKVVYNAMGLDIWEVVEAAKTKPFGYMPFYPGPGLGGHCVPIDPFYLTWKAREYDISTRFIELAGQINTRMPYLVVERLAEAVDAMVGKGLSGARVLILGIAYKKNVDDMRESPALKLIELIQKRGAHVDYHDPLIPVIPATREHMDLAGRSSVPINRESLSRYDAVLIATDHDHVDYHTVAAASKVVLDTRNACERAGVRAVNVVKA